VTTAIAKRPEQIRAEVATDPQRRQLLRDATAELLSATQAFITSYVALPHQAAPHPTLPHLAQPDRATSYAGNPIAAALALWVLHCWSIDAFDCTPYLMVTSDQPGSGKTRLLEVLGYLVPRPWRTAQATSATLFRKIESERPVMLLDETDALFSSRREALRGILDSGNRRGGTIARCEGRGIRDWSTFCPKAMAGLGELPQTLLERSIVIHMVKQHGTTRLQPRIAAQQAAPLAYTLEQWALIAVDELAQIEPDIPVSLSDRQADAWEPLLGIAAFASDEWSDAARGTAVALSGPSAGALEDADAGELLPAMASVMA
jgi:hypothetical protein